MRTDAILDYLDQWRFLLSCLVSPTVWRQVPAFLKELFT